MSDSVTRQTYDQIAGEFAVRNAEISGELLRSMERFLEWLGGHTRVLDVGCGHGRDSAYLQSRGKKSTGVDLSAGMLQEARRRGLGELAQMDMLSLGLCDQAFDGIWCCASLLHLPKHLAPSALAEFYRVLTTDGLLFLAVQEGISEAVETSIFSKNLPRFFARYQIAEVEAMLEQIGFRVIERGRSGDDKVWLHFFGVKH